MEQVSNKTLTFLIVVAIVVSIGGTMISINRINKINQARLITGMAGTGTGYVNVTIAAVASVSVLEGQIDFGSCSPNATIGANLSSNVSTDWGSPGVCSSIPNNPDNITIKNDGNTFVNITVRTGTLASSLLGGSSPYPPQFLFMTRNASSGGSYSGIPYEPGCFNRTNNKGVCTSPDGTGGIQWNWKNFSDITTNFCVCDNLSYGSTANAIYLFAKLDVPADAVQQGEKMATLTVTATQI